MKMRSSQQITNRQEPEEPTPLPVNTYSVSNYASIPNRKTIKSEASGNFKISELTDTQKFLIPMALTVGLFLLSKGYFK